MLLEQSFVPAGDRARGMAPKVSELDDETRKSRARPSRRICPDSKVTEHGVDDRIRRTLESLAECAERGECQLMLCCEYGREKLVLAPEVVVKGAFGQLGRRGDVVHADTGEALAAEQRVAGIQNVLARLC